MKKIKHIKFINRTRPKFDFDLIKLEWVLSRDMDYITQPHVIDFFHILFITEGKGIHTIDFTDYEYIKGTIFTIRKDQTHRFTKNPNTKGFLLLFTDNFLTSHFGKNEVLRAFQLFNDLLVSPKIQLTKKEFEVILRLITSIESEYEDHDDEFSRGIIRSALHVLVMKLFRIKAKESNQLSTRKYSEKFLRFQQLVEDNFAKTRKTIDYANMMNCTTKTLNNICRTILDKSAKSVINQIVIIQIKRLLVNTSFSISEIAYESGFDEPTNMYRYFKKHTNLSPETFRKANR
ncbi:MAG: helix-turn-helix transcriptional regulator [Marinifilaceae bacterium]